MLRTRITWVPPHDLEVWVLLAPVEATMAELAIAACLKLDLKRVVQVLLVAENLFVHVDGACVLCVACVDRALSLCPFDFQRV